MSSTLTVLTRARARITDRRHWTHGAAARDRRSRAVGSGDQRAVRWCASGALWAELFASRDLQADPWPVVQQALAPHASSATLSSFNDTRGHAAVLALYDAAIEIARSEAQP